MIFAKFKKKLMMKTQRFFLRIKQFLPAISLALMAGACNNSGSGTSATTDTSAMSTKIDTPKVDYDSARNMAMQINNEKLTDSKQKEDANRLVELVTMNYDEVKIMQLALLKNLPAGLSSSVQQMIGDHQKAIRDLTTMAAKKGFSVPSQPDQAGVNKYNDLNKEAGNQFQKDFLTWAVDAHNGAISDCQNYSKKANDPDLINWCKNVLPTLQMHLQIAKTALDNFNSSNK